MTKQSERLKAAMKLARIKQTVLAEKTGIVQGTISNYARGVYAPRGENLTKNAVFLMSSELVTPF